MSFLRTVDTLGKSEVLTQNFQNEKLIIRPYANGFSYSLYQDNRLLWLERLEFTDTSPSFEKIIEFLKHKLPVDFKTVECISDAESYIVFPKNTNTGFELEKYRLDESSDIVYDLRSDLKKAFKTAYPQTVFQNSLIRVLTKFQSIEKIKGYGAILNFSDTSAGFVLLYHEKLQVIRNFEITRKEDFLYQLMYVFHQLEVPTHQVVLFISGLIDKDSKMIAFLKKYFTLVFLSEPVSQGRKTHYYFDIN